MSKYTCSFGKIGCFSKSLKKVSAVNNSYIGFDGVEILRMLRITKTISSIVFFQLLVKVRRLRKKLE